MKTITTLISIAFLSTWGFTQINSNPGSYNWSSTAAWSGGVVPAMTDVVNITSNSTINVDFPLTHNADINVNSGGLLVSMVPANTLTMNDANLTITNGQFVFAGGVAVVDVTINNGLITNNGFYTSGNLYLSYLSFGSNSVNNGDFMVSGNMELAELQVFDNNLAVMVSATLTVNAGCSMNNNQMVNAGDADIIGTFTNLGSWNVTNDIGVNPSGVVTSSGGFIGCGGNYNNDGSTTISDSLSIDLNLENNGTITNNGGAVNIQTDYNNLGTTTGSLTGLYYIAAQSYNDALGIINGVIDICDATLAPFTYLDIDNGQSNIDFNTVTFCMTSIAGIDTEMLDNIVIAPNPTEGIITIGGISSGTYQIHANDGRILLFNSFDGASNEIDLSRFPTGSYQIVINTENGIVTKKILKF